MKQKFLFFIILFIIPFSYSSYSQDNIEFLDTLNKYSEFKNIESDGFDNNNILNKQNYTLNEQLIINSVSDNISSVLEINYSDRAGDELKQYGYNIFNRSFVNNSFIQGAVQDDYILGVGDDLVLILYGAINKTQKKKVSQDGAVFFEEVGIISVAGKKLSEVKKILEIKINDTLLQTEFYLSLGRIKQINVNIMGEVNRPGVYSISGLASFLDALTLAGGIKKSGSLRNINIINNDKVEKVDLYNFLFQLKNRSFKNPSLTEGSIIVVPSIGKTFAVSGEVNKPGIYELLGDKVSIQNGIDFSGGISGFGKSNISVETLNANGNLIMNGNINSNQIVKDGDLIISNLISLRKTGHFKVIGSVIKDGIFPLNQFPTLKDVFVKNNILLPNSYIHSTILKTINLDTKLIEYKIINLDEEIKSNGKTKINSEDEMYILNYNDLKFLQSKLMYKALIGALNIDEIINVNYLNKENDKPFCTNVLLETDRYVKSLGTDGITKVSTYKNHLENIFSGQNKFKNILKESEYDTIEQPQVQNFISPDESKDSDNVKELLYAKYRCDNIFANHPELIIPILKNIFIINGNVDNPGIFFRNLNEETNKIFEYLGLNQSNFFVSHDGHFASYIPKKISIDLNFTGISNIKTNQSQLSVKQFLLDEASSLSSIFFDLKFVSNGIYPFFAYVEREDFKNGIYSNLTFSPSEVLSKRFDLKLKEGDKVKFFSREFINNFLLSQNSNKKNTNYNTEMENNKVLDKEETLDDKAKPLYNIETNPILLDKKDTYYEEDYILSSEKHNEFSEIKQPSIINENKPTFSKIQRFLNNNTASIIGAVVSPGNYPIAENTDISQLISYAGGVLNDANLNDIRVSSYKGIKININKVNPGDKLFIPYDYLKRNGIVISGNITEKLNLDYSPNIEIFDIFNNFIQFKKDTYLNFAVVERKNLKFPTKQFFAFSPLSVIQNIQNFKLEPGDNVIIFSQDEINELLDDYNLNKTVSNIDLNINVGDLSSPHGTLENLINSLIIRIEGAVTNPGPKLVAGPLNLKDLLKIFGDVNKDSIGTISILEPIKNNSGDIALIEDQFNLNEYDKISKIIYPGSTLRIPENDNDLNLGYVEIEGEVNQNGKYAIIKGNSIFDILKRSGGLKENAYIEGMVFSREEEKNREKNSIDRLRRELDKALASAIEKSGGQVDESGISALRELSLAASDFKPIGRIVGDFNNIEILKNTKVRNGDKIFIPNKPTSVTVVGEVMMPGSIIWDKKLSSFEYIQKAAGLTELGNSKNIFIISPNGRARKYKGLWSGQNKIAPGSIVVVPRKIELSTSLDRISAISSVVYQLTLSLAGIDNVLNN